jgi:SNF2 family DNA or RNA helicase
MVVLDALLKLRQICNSPALIKGAMLSNESVKIQELVRHITQKTGNHKILIFSQFVEMLGLIKKEIQKTGVKFEYLDGSIASHKREAIVQNFQQNDEIRIFLISLKAGGVGLNLTEADYVYLVDPWWNPAVEAQAIDRTHRIGQTKKVFAYKMICKDTIEEKVLLLQEKKKKVASDIISTEQSFYKQLEKEDIMELFG